MHATVWLLEPLLRHHQAELRRQATAARGTGRRGRRPGRRTGGRRERLGWTLVEIGLRLALPHSDCRPPLQPAPPASPRLPSRG